ncbi:MAG: transporter substrate-binding domain-containing protein [Pseudomonadota bacterium]|nr:transporter substrate-binding domain-containing protein [Pseudomonadota bacterium]
MRIALIIILYIFTCLFQGTLVYAHDMESEVFKVAIEDSWPPYADENGEGISRDILERALKYSDIEYEIQVEPYSRALYLTQIGATNACLNVTRQASTENLFYFGSEPLLYANAYFYVRADKDVDFKSLKDVPDKYNLAVMMGYEYGDIFEQEKYRFNLLEVRSQEQIINMLITDRIDGTIMFEEVQKYTADKMGVDQALFKKAFLNQISDVYIAFHKDAPKSKEYAEKIDAALHAMRIKNNRAVD